MPDPVHPAVRSVLDLFASDLASVRFPELDAAVLSTAAEAVTQRSEEVHRAEAALDQARLALNEAQDGLLGKAHRAVGYAKVYAEDDPALVAKLEGIALPRAPRRLSRSAEPLLTPTDAPAPAPSTTAAAPAPKRRGRPPKQGISTSAPLFGTVPEGATAGAEAPLES